MQRGATLLISLLPGLFRTTILKTGWTAPLNPHQATDRSSLSLMWNPGGP